MANGDGDQSKRPALSQHDSDSQASDHAQYQPGQQGAQYHRPKTSKHHVGGRLHARVPSTKTLHKTHGSSSSAKLSRRQASPSPDHALVFPPPAPLTSGGHRRATSELNLSRDASATNLLLKKNASHSSLKRNRSKVDVAGKKSKSSVNLKSHGSSTALHGHKHAKAANQVHFNLGDDDDDDDDNQEDEWVDASTSASPLLSRRTSVVSGGQRSATSSAANSRPPTASEQEPQQPQSQHLQQPHQREPPSPRSAHGQDSPSAISTSQHSQYLTSRVLERTPAQGAPPMMSTETVSTRATVSSSHAHSHEDPENTAAAAASAASTAPSPRLRPGSSGGKAELTSRFVTTTNNSSAGSGSNAGPDSFTGALARAANGRIEVVGASAAEVRRPRSTGNLLVAGRTATANGGVRPRRRANGQTVDGDEYDEEDRAADGPVAPLAGSQKKAPAYVMNRTQQKINLQRASSSLEPTMAPHHPALSSMVAAGPASVVGPGVGVGVGVGGGGYGRGETVLPRLLERTGMEYLVVRRYQNPVARSLARLAQLPGQDRKLRIPKQRASMPPPPPGHSRQGSELRSGPVQSLRDREVVNGRASGGGDVAGLGLIGGRAAERRPGSRRGLTYGPATTAVNGGGDGHEENHVGLSGSSLVDGGEDATTIAVLRNLWDKNMDLSASQD